MSEPVHLLSSKEITNAATSQPRHEMMMMKNQILLPQLVATISYLTTMTVICEL
jgi:hypothetical protein